MKAIVDCNSFYCACERVFRPDLTNKAVVVLSNNDGCIVSRSDEAKDLGIKMAGPYFLAKPIIEKNGVAVFSSNYHLYGDMSQRVMQTLKELVGAEKVEVYSIDESFVDLSHVAVENLFAFCAQLKQVIEQWTGIPVSIGVAPTKVLSKAANRLAKKNKQSSGGVVVAETAEKIAELLKQISVEEIWGVGQKNALKLAAQKIETAWQLSQMNEEWARKNLGGVVGLRLIKELRGEPCIDIKDPLETKKMIATTRMFGKPVTTLAHLKEAVATYCARSAEKLRRQSCAVKTIEVFLVTNNYTDRYQHMRETKSKSFTLPVSTSGTNEIISYALPLVEQLFQEGSRYVKAGVIFSGLVPDSSIQTSLFNTPATKGNRHLMNAIDNVNFSMRGDVIKFAASGLTRDWKMRQELRSGKFTTDWNELSTVR